MSFMSFVADATHAILGLGIPAITEEEVQDEIDEALAEFEGGGVAREQAAFTGAGAGNGQKHEWALENSTGTPTVGIVEDAEQFLTFTEDGLWAISAYYDIVVDGGNVTTIDYALEHDGTSIDLTFDILQVIPAQGSYQAQWERTWWFNAGDTISFATAWALDGGVVSSTSSRLFMTRLA